MKVCSFHLTLLDCVECKPRDLEVSLAILVGVDINVEAPYDRIGRDPELLKFSR